MISEILRDHGLGKGLNGADKKALIDAVNAADTNQSVVKTNIINALKAKDANLSLTNASTFADIVASIPSLYIGKKWATGTCTIQGASGQTNKYTVTGLSFVPKTILAFSAVDPATNPPSFHGYSTVYAYNDAGFTSGKWQRLDTWSTSMFVNQTTAPTTGQFTLTNVSSSAYTDYIRWFAFE
ncbi:hypothetical protein ABE430_08830 [Brevibacillus agri]|uniref:hypothetical protein n=1 Tax=Brevibacillus agri TaxID=51101 RepID=UPI003D1B4CBE